MIVIGLTGSIGMGKSSVSAMLDYLNVPVHDADGEVHKLLKPGSAVWSAFIAAFPYFSYPQIYDRKHGLNPFKKTIVTLNRRKLGALVFNDQDMKAKLEGILHPFVQEAQIDFIHAQKRKGLKIVALDIPLLFETGADKRVDYVINVSAPDFVQEARVMARPGMEVEKFSAILAQQMPDGEKCARADYVVHSGLGRAVMMKEIKKVLIDIKSQSLKGRAA